MNFPAKAQLTRLTCCLLILMVVLACSFLAGPAQKTSPAPPSPQKTAVKTPAAPEQPTTTRQSASATPAVAQQTPTSVVEPTLGPDPLDHLLSMRSITIQLAAQRPDGSSSLTHIEIDSAGNLHVKFSLPAMPMEELPQATVAAIPVNSGEIFVVDGKVYQVIGTDKYWMSTPVDEDYLSTLSTNLHGPDGPGLWLDMLPDGSLTSAGKETVGGFDTNKYTVNGTVDGQAITGSLWFEPQANALVKAELIVPEEIYHSTEKSLQAQLKISLDAQKADVPFIKLPEAPPQPTAIP